jgi:hypothetical protein
LKNDDLGPAVGRFSHFVGCWNGQLRLAAASHADQTEDLSFITAYLLAIP